MQKNMETPVMSVLFLASALVGFLAIAAEARTLLDSSHLKVAMIITYRRSPSPPPPSPVPSPATKELTGNYDKPLTSPPPPPKLSPPTHELAASYGRTLTSPPPPPKVSPPKGELEIGSSSAEGSPYNTYISMVTDYGRISTSPPPPPKPASPTHHMTFVGQMVQERSPPSHFLAST